MMKRFLFKLIKNMIMKRIQRKRTKGWRMPENCKYVGRPTKFGNPFKLTPDGYIMFNCQNGKILDPWIYWSITAGFNEQDVLDLYGAWIGNKLLFGSLPTPPDIEELRGKDLACFCALDKPCHVDVLLKLLNQ
jgi:hypothetical protein